MSALSLTHAASLLESSLRSGAYYLALFLTDPTAADDGVEVTGGGYSRKAIAFRAPSVVSGKTQVSNTADIDFGTITADIGTVSFWGIYTAQSGGNLLWHGPFTRTKNVQTGDAITVTAGAIVCTLS